MVLMRGLKVFRVFLGLVLFGFLGLNVGWALPHKRSNKKLDITGNLIYNIPHEYINYTGRLGNLKKIFP